MLPSCSDVIDNEYLYDTSESHVSVVALCNILYVMMESSNMRGRFKGSTKGNPLTVYYQIWRYTDNVYETSRWSTLGSGLPIVVK